MPSRKPVQILTLFILMQLLMWTQGRSLVSPSSATARLLDWEANLDSNCSPLTYPMETQCNHVQEHCPETTTFLSLPHLRHYFCATKPLRPLVLIGSLLWMLLLFTTLGICASDFLCPNLSTIAHVFGLDDNVAGVTLLAIGNGSPDLFATFSAMKANSGSLAIGELLGAASFIVSVVVGSMCIIKPFHVHPRPFLRDVGFFTLATCVLLWILHDGILRQWEVNLLVGLYGLYVCLVITGTWWEKRREKRRLREAIVREELVSDNHPLFLEPYRDEVSPPINLDVRPPRSRAISTPDLTRTPYPVQRRSRSRSPPRLSSHDIAPTSDSANTPSLPHFSLLTALEFRDLVSSLQNQANFSELSLFDNSIGSLNARHSSYRSPSVRSRFSAPITPLPESENNPLERIPDQINSEYSSGPTDATLPPVVSSLTVPAAPGHVYPGFKRAFLNVLHSTYNILFPHLHDLFKKSLFSFIVAVLATPGVVALTLTVPVVSLPYNSISNDYPTVNVPEGRLIDEHENEALEVQGYDRKEDQFNKWLTALQCALGPLFCAVSLLGLEGRALWYILAAVVAGLAIGVLVLVFSDERSYPVVRLPRCLMGFFISVVWIMIIADEIAFGLIFGLSDAIIGLTVFAIGNSLADLVANTSIAAFAPIMGFSACFGGPMLNILLGVGVSGSLIIQETGHNYNLHFSTTLLISVLGLLTILVSTLIFVPRNGYFLTRSWGVFLIISYVIIMVTGIIVEITHSQILPDIISPYST